MIVLAGPARRDHLEPDHLVLRPALVVLARPDRRAGRRGARRPGSCVNWQTIVDKVADPDGRLAAARLRARVLGDARDHVDLPAAARPHKVLPRLPAGADRLGRRMLALGHGLQDAQKTMGVIFLALVAGGYYAADDRLPLWVVFAAAGAISLGTYSGGWRIMRTLGRRIIHLDPARGFSAESTRRGRALHHGLRLRTPRSPPPTPSPARSWAPAPPSASPPCAGASPAPSSPPGCSTFPAAGSGRGRGVPRAEVRASGCRRWAVPLARLLRRGPAPGHANVAHGADAAHTRPHATFACS